MRGKAEFKTMDLNIVETRDFSSTDIEIKGFNELDDSIETKGLTDFSKSPILNAVKKLRTPNGSMPNVVPDDLKAGIDKFSKINRLKTAENYSGSGPAKNTIMASRQASGNQLAGIRPNAEAYRGSQKVNKPIGIEFGGRRPNSYDKPIQKELSDNIEIKGKIKEFVKKIPPVIIPAAIGGAGFGALGGSIAGSIAAGKKNAKEGAKEGGKAGALHGSYSLGTLGPSKGAEAGKKVKEKYSIQKSVDDLLVEK